MTWVKICATTSTEDALASVDAGADALGFIFAPSARRMTPKDVGQITNHLPKTIEKFGVFINQRPAIVLETVLTAGLTGVQLHGSEDVASVRELARLRQQRGAKFKILKGLHARELMPEHSGGAYGVEFTRSAGDVVDAYLLDSGTPERRGGTGKTFDWDEAAPMVRLLARKHKVVIAGGLNAGNVRRAIGIFGPWGVDVVTGVEREPGKKDHEKLKAFVAAVRSVEEK